MKNFRELANPVIATSNMRFFKQGPGSYCEHDLFLGISAPNVKTFLKTLPIVEIKDIRVLITSSYNEERVLGWLLIEKQKLNSSDILELLRNFSKTCGNWNVVDTAAPSCAKTLLKNKESFSTIENIGWELNSLNDLWSVRMAIVLALVLIRNNQLDYALKICKFNLTRKEDMIRKPIGWMLREIGKKDKSKLTEFLKENIHEISSVSLSYALEHFEQNEKNSIRLLKKH